MTRYDGGPYGLGYDYAGKWLWRVVEFALVIFVGHVVLAHVGFIANWADALPSSRISAGRCRWETCYACGSIPARSSRRGSAIFSRRCRNNGVS